MDSSLRESCHLVLPLTDYYRSNFHTTVVRFLTPTSGELQDYIFITPPSKNLCLISLRVLNMCWQRSGFYGFFSKYESGSKFIDFIDIFSGYMLLLVTLGRI